MTSPADNHDPARGTRYYRGLTHAAIRRPVGTLALASVVFVLGLFFVDRLPVNLLPEIIYPHVRVTVNYPGVAPEVMEEQVTRVLERQLAAAENLSRIYSRASEGRTNINLIFEYGVNLDHALQDASRLMELARTQLPPDIDPPRLYKFDPSQDPVYEAGFSSTIRTPREVRDWVEHRLAPQLLSLHGVAGVEAAGGLVRELEVIVDQDRLAFYGLTLQDVAAALAGENLNIAAGQVTSPTFDVMARTDGRFRSPEDVGAVLLGVPGSTRRIRLDEIAEVRDGYREQRLFVRLSGVPATRLSVFKLPEANTVGVVDSVHATLRRLEASGFIPEDIRYEATTDSAFFIRGSLAAVTTAALIGGTLAMLVVLAFLGSLRKSFVIGLSIPLAVLATFALMGMSGLTLNIMSLGGLALGVGLLLDNAIVMLENIARHRDRLGKADDTAAHEGADEVISAITAGTLTNLAAVAPFLLITGLASLVFRELILTISFAIVASLAVALTLVPMLAAQLARLRFRSGLDRSRIYRGFDAGIEALTKLYRGALGRILRWRWLVLAAALVLFIGAIQVFDRLGTEFLPPVDDGQVTVHLRLPPGTPPDRNDAAARMVEREIQNMPHVDSVFAMVGGHLSGGVISERPGTAHIRVRLLPAEERSDYSAGRWVADLQQRLNQLDLPGARITVRPPRIQGLQFGVTGDDLSIGVMGDELAELQRIGRELVARLEGIHGLEGVEIGREDRTPLLGIDVDRERAAALGLGIGEVGRALRDAVTGTVPTRYTTGWAEYDVRVRLPRSDTSDADALGHVIIQHGPAGLIQLRDVATFSLGEGPAHIERENQGRILRVNGSINPALADVGTVMAEVEARLRDMTMPEQYSLVLGGQWETIQETARELRIVIALAVFLVFVVLAVQYERLSNPLVIMAAAPLALVGVVALLWITRTPASAPVFLGVILLIGIVVNNAILLVEYIERGRARGLDTAAAVVEAGGVRLRPILMTTLTTVAGMSPLAIGMGAGADIMQPLALSVVGGLITAMLLTLFLVPCLYVIVQGVVDRLSRALLGDRNPPALVDR
ncbi:MAG: efflux RND transporter permease subunit [Gammaproteobacteria bacterium]|nr:efflux RND transporter permease subunit [Gammaproteobacteria bacterium]